MSKAKQNQKGKLAGNTELPDSARDKEELKNEATSIDIPEVEDIPGQEHIHPPKLTEYADTTTSSSDEEGDNLWDDEEVTEKNSTVSPIEKRMLQESAGDMPTNDEQSLRRSALDSTDNEGDPLNEKASSNAISGSDLDVPGADEDDADEEIGEEDEENNPYSLGGDDNSINEERSGV